jgi:hypothetical protein
VNTQAGYSESRPDPNEEISYQEAEYLLLELPCQVTDTRRSIISNKHKLSFSGFSYFSFTVREWKKHDIADILLALTGVVP